MATLQELQDKLQANLDSQRRVRDDLDFVKGQVARGEVSQSNAQQELNELSAKLTQLELAEAGLRQSIENLGTANEDKEAADEEADQAASDDDKAQSGVFNSQEAAIRAQTLYDQANGLFEQSLLGLISTTQLEIRLEEINTELISLDFLPWKAPPPPSPPPAPPAAEAPTVDLTRIETLLGKQGDLTALVANSEIAIQLQTILEDGLVNSGFSDELADQARQSPIDPTKAAETAKALTLAILGGVSLAGSAVIAAEAVGLGQLETPASVLQMIFGASGLDDLARDLANIPFQTGIIRGTERHWNSINQAELPGSGDLIRFLVRETIDRDRFDQAMREQGFSQEWTDAFWVSHWREISRRDVLDAFHRGVINADERDKYLVILDFRPDARPGISKPDLEVISSIGKRLIPRVDLRRAFKLGVVDYDQLVKSYTDIGYEEDAELMAFIQSNTAFEGAQNAVIRAGGQLFKNGIIQEADFMKVHQTARSTFDDWTLWHYRYILERQLLLGKAAAEDASGEEVVEESTELNETQEDPQT